MQLLTGDIEGLNPLLRQRLERLAKRIGRTIHVTSGLRSTERQRQLWNGAPGNGLIRGVSVAPPGGSLHEGGFAADATIDGVPIHNAVKQEDLRDVDLYTLGAKDTVHVQLYPPGTTLEKARKLTKLLTNNDGPLGVNKRGGPLADTWIGDRLGDVGAAIGDVLGDGVDAAADATARALVGMFADWMRESGLRALLAVVLVGGGVVLATMGISRAAGARREVTA